MKILSKSKILMIAAIILLVALLSITAYAWFESSFDPVIYSDTMYITATDGLIIQLTDKYDTDQNPGVANEINIREVVRDQSNFFELPQVSSADGENFYRRKRTTTGHEYYQAKVNEDYIEVTFMLSEDPQVFGTTVESPDRYIFLQSFDLYLVDSDGVRVDSANKALDAIRTSLKFEETGGESGTEPRVEKYIIARDSKTTGNVPARFDGCNTLTDYTDYDSSAITAFDSHGYTLNKAIKSVGEAVSTNEDQQNVRFASNFIYNECDLEFSTLTKIKSDTGVKIIMRIWLEGSDPACDLDISGLRLYYNMKFGSYYYIHNFYQSKTDKTIVKKPIIVNKAVINSDADNTFDNVVQTFYSDGPWYSGFTNSVTTTFDYDSSSTDRTQIFDYYRSLS